MSVFDCVEERLMMFTGMAYHGYGLWTWYYNAKGELYYTTCPYEKELQTFFYLGGCLDYAASQKDEPEVPFLMSDSVGLVWLGEYIVHPGAERRFLVVGPAFGNQTSVFGISDELKRMNISQELSRTYLNLLRNMPVIPLQQFQSLAKALHYSIGFTDTQNLSVRFQQPGAYSVKEVWKEQDTDFERENHREKMLLQYVKDGNSSYGDIFDLFLRTEKGEEQGKNPVRSAKNALLVFASKCANAAMEGGIPIKTAKELEKEYMQRIERQKSVTGLAALCRKMMDAFTGMVAEYKNNTSISQPVYMCCSYIKEHLSDPITLQELADYAGYTEYYLGRKFHKETGVKLLDYIRKTRLDYAKILLSTTNLSVQEICEKLQFGTRNYFTRVFKKEVGISPMEYRKNVWGNREDEKDETEN